jgi:hypothetical protein
MLLGMGNEVALNEFDALEANVVDRLDFSFQRVRRVLAQRY